MNLSTEHITIIRQDRQTLYRGRTAYSKPRIKNTVEFYHDILNADDPKPGDRRLIVTLEYWTTLGNRTAKDEQNTLTTRTARSYKRDPNSVTGGGWQTLSEGLEQDISPDQARALYDQIVLLMAEQFHAPHDWRSQYRRPGYHKAQNIALPAA